MENREGTLLRVFVLQHTSELPDGTEDVKLIGVYSDPALAEQAQVDLGLQPGFREHPDGFELSEYVLNMTHWREGFVRGDFAEE